MGNSGFVMSDCRLFCMFLHSLFRTSLYHGDDEVFMMSEQVVEAFIL